MIKSYGFMELEYDTTANFINDQHLTNEVTDYVDFLKTKDLYYDDSVNKWVRRSEYSGDIYPATLSCRSLRAAKRHLRKHDEIPKGSVFRLVSWYVGRHIMLIKK